MRAHSMLSMFKTMEFGFKRRDFLAFILFPRVWREIERLRRDLDKARHLNKRYQNLLLNNYIDYEEPK